MINMRRAIEFTCVLAIQCTSEQAWAESKVTAEWERVRWSCLVSCWPLWTERCALKLERPDWIEFRETRWTLDQFQSSPPVLCSLWQMTNNSKHLQNVISKTFLKGHITRALNDQFNEKWWLHQTTIRVRAVYSHPMHGRCFCPCWLHL